MPAEQSVRALWASLVSATSEDEGAAALGAAKKFVSDLQQHPEVVVAPGSQLDRPVAAANASALNELAWRLVDKDHRHYPAALLLAERACELSPEDYNCLDTLA